MKKILGILLCAAFVLVSMCTVFAVSIRDTMPDTWVGGSLDANCMMPGYEQVGGRRAGTNVGMFYYIWHSDSIGQGSIKNIRHINNGLMDWGSVNGFHYWDEPWLGYYSPEDPFVIRKHAQMLTDAGVDVILFDNTNGLLYADTILQIMKVYTAMREEGNDTPQISSIMHNTADVDIVVELYDKFFGPNVSTEVANMAKNLWYKWNGKYLLLADRNQVFNNGASPSFVKNNFEVRTSWINGGQYSWPWTAASWSAYGYTTNSGIAEQTFVTSADPSVTGKGKSSNQSVIYRDGDSRINPRLGTFFKAQWEKALSINPPFILVTQFNEWIAQRQKDGTFVDLWNWEFNRDIEPMKDFAPDYGYGDNYMYYLHYYIRRYKGVRQLPTASSSVTIDIKGDFSQWDSVAPQYLDDVNDTIHRHYRAAGVDTLRKDDEFYYLDIDYDIPYYVNNTGRNDFDTMKVARDAGYVYFYVKTSENITAPDNNSTWMQLLINTNASYNDGWYGYEYILNRKVDLENNYGMLEKSLGGWSWNEIGQIELRIDGNQMMLAIPREWLGLDAASASNISLDFKWLDNVRCSASGFNPMDFIDKGDVAPNDRYNYRYKADFPAIRYNAVALETMSIDVNLYPAVSARILTAMSGTLPTATKVEYLSETKRGIIDENGTFIQQLLIGEYHEKLRYHLLDNDNNVLGFGIVILTNEESAHIFRYQGASVQKFVPDHDAKTGIFYVSYESKLWDVILSETAPGDFYLDGTHINGYNVFNFYKEDPVGMTLEYHEYGQSVTYTIDIVRDDAPEQVANTMTLFAGNTLPGSDSLWEAKKVGDTGDFEINVIHGSSCYTHVSDGPVALFGLKKPYAAPYIFDFQMTVDHKDSLVPHHSGLVNIRGTSSEEYITSYLGIWFGVIKDQVILMKNTNGFADMKNYSVATIENGVDVSAEFGNIIVNDSGDQITISAIDATGATIKVFEISNITGSTFDYENLITGEKATATSKEIAGKDNGYITFFRHPSAKIGYRNIKLGPNLEKIPAGLVTFSLLDPATMSEISDSVVISNDDSSRTINITVGYDADLSKVVVSYVPSLYGTRVLVGGKPISKTPITQLKNGSGSLIMVGGGTTRTYKVMITRTLVPKFRFKDVDAQVINIDNINNVINATVGRGTKLETMVLEVLSSGSATVDGTPLDGTPIDFSKNPTGRTLVYTEGEETKTYTLNIYVETVIPTASTFQFKDIIFQTTAVDNENKIITITLGKGTPTNNLRLLTATSGSKTYINGIDSAYEWFNFDNNLTGHTLVYDDGGEPITYTFNIEVEALPEQGATKLVEQFTCDTMPTVNDTWQCVERIETGEYRIGDGYGDNAIYLDHPQHHLVSTRKTIVTPYVFDFEFSLLGDSLAPHFGNMFNIRSEENDQFMTSYKGIWFTAYNNNLMLYTSNQYGISFADPASYSVVTTENTKSFNGQGYVAIRVVDNGNNIVVKYRNDNGKYIDAFTISGIGSKSFSFKNMQTGATGTGYSEGILRDGYMNFFHHGGLGINMFLNQFSFYSATDSFDSYISNFDLIDPVSGKQATQNVVIDKEKKTIDVEVVSGVPLTSLKASYTATVANGILMQGSNLAEDTALDYSKPVTLTYTDGQVTENYTVNAINAAPATGKNFLQNEKVKISYENSLGKPIDNVCFLIGCYDADGRLLCVIRQVRTVNAKRNIYDIEISDICPENTAFVKFFSWEAPETLNPLASKGEF